MWLNSKCFLLAFQSLSINRIEKIVKTFLHRLSNVSVYFCYAKIIDFNLPKARSIKVMIYLHANSAFLHHINFIGCKLSWCVKRVNSIRANEIQFRVNEFDIEACRCILRLFQSIQPNRNSSTTWFPSKWDETLNSHHHWNLYVSNTWSVYVQFIVSINTQWNQHYMFLCK